MAVTYEGCGLEACLLAIVKRGFRRLVASHGSGVVEASRKGKDQAVNFTGNYCTCK